jgi:hypothetical protein
MAPMSLSQSEIPCHKTRLDLSNDFLYSHAILSKLLYNQLVGILF